MPWVIVALVLGVVGFFVIRAPEEGETAGPMMGADGALPEASSTSAPVRLPRCKLHGPAAGHVIGEPSPGAPTKEEDDDLLFLPFSVEIGRAAATARGFAVGIKRDKNGSSTHVVALVDDRVESNQEVELGRSRGDLDAPVIASDGKGGWVAGLLEPNAGGLALRLARPGEGGVSWGAELEQGRDESLAFDVAIGPDAGVAVWDDLEGDGERAVVVLATVSPTLEARGGPVVVSSESVDAELPRVVVRDGGFWLAYVARARVEGAGERPEGRYAAERIVESWIELAPLDASGALIGVPRAVTPRDGHVLAFDLVAAPEGAVVIAWRDDDTPSGAQGGTVSTMRVGASGEDQVQPVADEDVGAGVPVLLPGFIALPDATGHPRLAPMDAEGTLIGELRLEPALRGAQVLAAKGDIILGARPDGKAIALITARCDRTVK